MKTEISKATEAELLGFHADLPNDAYHTGPGYSASDIVTMNDEGFPAWRWRKQNPKESSPDMLLGSVTHLLLEARIKNDDLLVASGVAVMPEFNTRTKDGKAERDAFITANAGKYLVNEEGLEHAHRMVDAVMNEPEAAGYLRGGHSEASIFVRHPEHGVLMKTRPDFLRPNDGLSINFKTCNDASRRGFIKSIADFAYDWKSAYYLEILRMFYGRDFDEIHILVEKNKDGGPCRVGVYSMPDEVIRFAQIQYQPILQMIAEMERTGIVPKLPAAIEVVDIPDWALRKCVYV